MSAASVKHLQRWSPVCHGCAELVLSRADIKVVEGRFGLLGCRAHATYGQGTCSTASLPVSASFASQHAKGSGSCSPVHHMPAGAVTAHQWCFLM